MKALLFGLVSLALFLAPQVFLRKYYPKVGLFILLLAIPVHDIIVGVDGGPVTFVLCALFEPRPFGI